MAQQKLWYLIAYDIRDPKRLRRVARRLQGYGVRMQYSIFRCRLSERELERLQWELKKIMQNEDDLLIVGLCATCVNRIAQRNKDEQWPQVQETFEIV